MEGIVYWTGISFWCYVLLYDENGNISILPFFIGYLEAE